MSHLNLGNHINSALKMDGHDGPSGPVPRWQRKARDKGLTIMPSSGENSMNRSAGLCITPHNLTPRTGPLLDTSYLHAGMSPSRGFLNSFSGGQGSNNSSLLAGGMNRSMNTSGLTRTKSPGRTLKLSLKQKTPTRLTPNTPLLGPLEPNSYAGDRFIPVRPTDAESERSHHLVMKHMQREEGNGSDEEELTQRQIESRAKMVENLNDGQPVNDRIVHFSKKAPSNAASNNNQKVLFSATKASASKACSTRHIPNVPERVLDAPELLDDYYLHLIDWSSHNHVVVALAGTVYLWNASDGSIVSLATIEQPEYICSLSWIKDGSVLAIGISEGQVQLWDAHAQKLIRTMPGHESRVATLDWNQSTLSSGSRTGQIIHHDVRIAQHVTGVINAHNQEVCGLAWNADGRLLASGGNDNAVAVWDGRSGTSLYRMSDHQAAVKAVSWCPWQSNLLSTGGGTADRTIRIWNANTGTCVKEVLTNSQVSSIVWNGSYKELITGHGFSQNQLTIWKYPNFTKVSELTGHTGRVLEMVPSPDGEMVASAAADETIRLWKVWPALPKDKKQSRSIQPMSTLSRGIR